MENLKKYIKETIASRPDLKEAIYDLYLLCKDEIEDGGSESHEIELCYSSIKELL